MGIPPSETGPGDSHYAPIGHGDTLPPKTGPGDSRYTAGGTPLAVQEDFLLILVNVMHCLGVFHFVIRMISTTTCHIQTFEHLPSEPVCKLRPRYVDLWQCYWIHSEGYLIVRGDYIRTTSMFVEIPQVLIFQAVSPIPGTWNKINHGLFYGMLHYVKCAIT